MPDIIEINDSDAVVRSKIIAILEFDGISTDDITSWGIATNRLNLAANRLGFNNITNNMPGSEARAIINQLAASPAPVYPENTVLPTISGNARYNQTLTATTGTWNGYPAPTYSYQWQADEIPIPGATSSTYLIKESDLGKQIRVGVTATNLSGPASVFSNPTAVVTSTPINSSLPTISGTAANGQTLTANNGTWIAFPVPAFTYQWKADGVNIAGATNQTLALGNNQIGREITVDVTATNSESFDTQTTNATARVTSAPINTVLPLVAAEIVEGKAVTTTSGTWLGYPVPTYAYQWKRNGTNISGATSSSYTPVNADVGQNITVTVTATNSVSAVQATSVAKMAKPAWAETFDAWRNFATNVGDLPNPEDIHTSAILAPNAAGTYQSFEANVLTRTDLGLQTVPTRTNLVANVDFSTAGWSLSNGATAIFNNNAAPDGTMLASTLTDSLTAGDTFVGRVFSIPNDNSVYAVSCFFKKTTGTPTSYPALFAAYTGGTTVTGYLVLNTTTGTFNIAGTATSAIVEDRGAFWRISFALPNNTTGNTQSNVRIYPAWNSTGAGTGRDATATGSVIAAWYQFELGSFASAPMLTNGTASTVTGNRQFISGLGSQLANGLSWLLDINPLGFINNDIVFSISDGTNNNRIQLQSSGGNLVLLATNNGTSQGSLSLGSTPTSRFVMAGVWANNYFTGRIVGLSAATINTTGVYPIVNRITFGSPVPPANQMLSFTRKLAIDYLQPGDDPAAAFANAYAKAQLAAAAP